MEKASKFSKPDRAIDIIPNESLKALEMVWHDESIHHFIHVEITVWFYMALSNECAVYVNDDMASRAAFIEFFSDLLPLIEATYCYNVSSLYYMKNHSSPDYKQLVDSIQDEEGQDYSFIYLTKKEMLDPRPVMTAFCLKYPIVYARRELWDFFQAAESYSGPFRAHVSKYMFSEYYLKLLTLVEAAYAITRQVPDKD